MSNILNHPPTKDLIQKIKDKHKRKPYVVSDIIQTKGGKTLQYIDVVMEGGGVLGIGLIGYLYALEKADIRFLSIGGTSAGSIAALFLMAIKTREDEKAAELIKIIENMPMRKFMDGDRNAQKLSVYGVEYATKKSKDIMRMVIPVMGSIKDIVEDVGLHPGDKFHSWATDELKKINAAKFSDLKAKIEHFPKNLIHRETHEPIKNDIPIELGIIASDITTETKVEFPKMAPMYWNNVNSMSPANFIRASMSIPLFFQPYSASGIREIKNFADKWKQLASFELKKQIPDTVLFADGGLMSNFPIDLFHGDHNDKPLAPTFGIKLGSKGRSVHKVNNVFSYAGALFNSMRHYADYDFVAKNPEYNTLIGYIDTGKHHWLNFDMIDKDKKDLFFRGVKAGKKFLDDFKWKEYKKLR